MGGKNPQKINFDPIKYILTLRYNPQKPLIPKLGWKDFTQDNPDQSIDAIEQIIVKTIKKNIKNSNKTKVCVSLSSGVDSTLTLALLKKSLPSISIQAMSVKFAGSDDETKRAEKIAKKANVEHKIIYLENFLQELPKAISIVKSPFWDLHWYYIVKNARKFSKILVSGDGGDELFGGYTFRYKKFQKLVKKQSTPIEKAKAYLLCHERDWVSDQDKIFGKKLRFSWNSIYKILSPYFSNSLPPTSQVFLADYNGKLLYNWMPNNTKLGEYFGVKTVTPLLSKESIFFATHLSEDLKYDKKNDIGKILLRKILKKYSYDSMISSTKQGFSVNTMNLWKSHGKKLCDFYLNDGRIISDGLINKNWVLSHLNNPNIDVRYVNKFLGLLAVEIWYRLFVTKEMKPDEQLIM